MLSRVRPSLDQRPPSYVLPSFSISPHPILERAHRADHRRRAPSTGPEETCQVHPATLSHRRHPGLYSCHLHPSPLYVRCVPLCVTSRPSPTDPIASFDDRTDWPILVVSVVSHLTSIFVSYVVFHRLFGLPGWIVGAMSFNSYVLLLSFAASHRKADSLPCHHFRVTSFPLLVFAALGLIPDILDHLSLSEIDLTADVVKRGTTYILVFAVISDTLR